MFYVRDVAGNEIALYDGTALKQWNVFGSGNEGKIDSAGKPLYYLKDHLGTIRAVVDSTNAVISGNDYDMWGYQMEGRHYATEETNYKFTGKERDNESKYDYFGARYYDSRIGRWGGVEPLLEKYISYSPYQYGLCNPVLMVDANGMEIDGSELEKEDNEDFKEELFDDLNEITGLQLYVDKEGKIRYKTDSEGNAIFKKKGTSSTARDKLMEVINDPDAVWKLNISEDYQTRTVVGSLTSNFNPDEISELVSGTVGTYSKTLGAGMNFLHEMYHTSLGGSLPDESGAYNTGPTVDMMNKIRGELGDNWGQRLSYDWVSLQRSNTIYIPMGGFAVSSLKSGEPPRTGYIRR